jgi:hypothetical protein
VNWPSDPAACCLLLDNHVGRCAHLVPVTLVLRELDVQLLNVAPARDADQVLAAHTKARQGQGQHDREVARVRCPLAVTSRTELQA